MWFYQIDTAFKVLTDKKAKERWGVDETAVKEQDIQVQFLFGALHCFNSNFCSTQLHNTDSI